MSKQTPPAVLFDIGNVILRSTHKITEAILWDLGVRPDKAALFFHGKHYSDFARGRIDGEEFATAVREVLEAPHLTDSNIRAAHNAHIYALDADVVHILERLYGHHIPLAFVTTTNAWQTKRELEFMQLADAYGGPVARSHEMGLTKTDPNVWPKILRRIEWQDRDPASILLVDDAKGNCDAASHAGLRIHQHDPTPVVGVEKLRIALHAHGVPL